MNFATTKQRILKYLDFKGLSVPDFLKETGIKRGFLDSDKLESAVSDKFLAKIIATYDDLSLNWLVTGNQPMLNHKITDQVNEESPAPYYTKGQMPKVISVSPEGDENIIMVPVPAQAGYLDGFGDPEFLESLPSYRLPTLNNGTFRIFEVKGHSMFPTIHSGALAVGEWCENWEDDIKDNQIYIIVSKEDGIVVKRCLNRIKKYNNLYLKSDNRREYPSYPIKPEDILEVWTLKTAFIYDFQDPADMYDRVNDLEARLMHVETTMPKINK